MSERDLFLSGGSAWFQGLGLVLVVIGLVTWCWFALHGSPYLLAVWRRGRAYRRALRRAKHRQRRDSLHHLNFRSPVQ